MLNIVLYEPEIPANTGNIGRTCVATGTRLHLIEPLGFKLSEKHLRRAGMDYWKDLDVTTYMDYEDFLAKEGKNVVRLKGGDPFIFGRGGEEAQELREAGVDYEIVPGVSSCYGAPAYAGIPVTHRDHASSFHVITGHEGAHKDSTVLDYGTLAKEEGTLVFLMGLKNLPNITKNLIANGKNPKTPAAVVQEGTTARQKVAVGTLETIVEEAKKAGIQTPAITVIGDVVSLRNEIGWYGNQPLSGKRVLVTATEKMTEHLAEVLEEEGADQSKTDRCRRGCI